MTPTQFKQHRQTLGLTQRGLATALGLSKAHGWKTISRIENGSYALDNDSRIAIQIDLLIRLENGK